MKPKADPHFTRKNQRRWLDDKVRLLSGFIDLKHPLVLLAQHIDWRSFETHGQRRFSDASGLKSAPALMAAGLLLLKHMEGLSDEGLMLAWVYHSLQDNQLIVRQTYAREAPRLAQKIGRYAHAKRFKRMRGDLKKLSTRVGCVMRELKRQLPFLAELAQMTAMQLIEQASKLRKQAKDPKLKNKLYALHEPDGDCISKGKAYKRYEFGIQVGIVCTP